MKKELIVLSLGGSIIVPEKINLRVLENFKKVIQKHTKSYKFIIVCGGGTVARKYIQALRDSKKSEYLQSLIGIASTRTNARFMSYFFNQDPEKGIPHKIRQIKRYLRKQNTVFCGGLEYKPHQTSDSTAATIASYFKTKFINITNVPGLYTDNPLKNKNAKFIPSISYINFLKRAKEIKFIPGQHFVLDQKGAEIILKNKVPTYILGNNFKELDLLLSKKRFKGTTISP